MAKKMIALLAVLTLVITPLFVIGEDLQAADPDKLTLDDINGKDTYWVKGTLDTSTGIMTLTNNESSTKYIPLLFVTTSLTVNKVVPGPDFYVPEKAAMIVVSVPFEINKDMTIYGTFGSNADENDAPLTKVTNDATLTFDGATIGYTQNAVCGYIDLGMGSSVVLDNSTLSIDGYIYLNGVEALDLDNVFCNNVSVKNTSTTTESKLEFTGTMTGIETNYSDICFYSDVVYSLKNFSGSNMNFDFTNINQNVFMYNDGKIIDLSGTALVKVKGQDTLNFLKSGGGTNLVIMDVELPDEGGTGKIIIYGIKATIDSDGMTAFFTLMTMASTGIKSIDAEKRIAFLLPGEKVDLTKIAVTCESGYHFVGWYYEDHNGNMVKVLDPANYVAVGDETLYAMAEADAPAQKDYTGFFIGLIILLALIVLVACVGIYLKATERSVKKASKR